MKPEPQSIRWASGPITVVDANQTVTSVRNVLQTSRTPWVVVCRPESPQPSWYVFSRNEFEDRLKSASSIKQIKEIIPLSDFNTSYVVVSRQTKVRPRKIDVFEPVGRVVLIDPRTSRVSAIGTVPVLVPTMKFRADQSFVSRKGGARGGGVPVTRHAKKAAKKAARKARGGGERIRKSSNLFDLVQVMFATDRKLTSDKAGSIKFANQRCDDDRIQYGICDVTIPKKGHDMGRLESPWLHLQFLSSPAKHVTVMRTDLLATANFYKQLRGLVRASSEEDAFIFIPGYNVSFIDGARRTAQIAYDLKFKGAPILYSWPSRAALLGYAADSASVDVTATRLYRFLQSVAERSGAKTLHIIAHSMGNRALLVALERLATRSARPVINNVILAAPDIDVQRFRQIAEAIHGYPLRTTLYASSNDKALKQAHKLYKGSRAGESGKNIVVVDGVDTVDASSVDTNLFSLGHGYVAENRTVLSDINELLQGKPPGKRFQLCKQKCSQGTYWAFRR